MKKQNLMSLAAVFSAGLLHTSLLTLPAQAQTLEILYRHLETFDDPVPLAASPEEGKWYPDRYRPAAFETFDLNGENVLRVGIDADNDGAANRPGGQQTVFYNTQGRRLDLPAGTTRVSAELFFPEDWVGADTRRRSDLWAIAATYDENGDPADPLYPILGIANENGTPVIRYWDDTVGPSGSWVNTSITPVPNTWYRFDLVLDTVNQVFIYYVNGTEVGRFDSAGALEMGGAFIQAYNFNNSALDPAMQSDESYDAYWDNFSYDFDLYVPAPPQPDLSVGTKQDLYSHKGLGSYTTDKDKHVASDTATPRGKTRHYVGLTNRGDRVANVHLKANGQHPQVQTKVVGLSVSKGNVTSQVFADRYTVTLAPGASALYRVETKLTGKAKRERRFTHQTVFRARTEEPSVDAASIQAKFRSKKKR